MLRMYVVKMVRDQGCKRLQVDEFSVAGKASCSLEH